MKKLFVFSLALLSLVFFACGDAAGEQGGILPDAPVTDPLKPNPPTDQDANENARPDTDGAGNEDTPTPPEEDGEDESELDVPDVYTLQSEWGTEVLTLDFYEGTYTLTVNTTHTGSYTAVGNCVTLALFDVQNVWTVEADGSMTLGENGEAAELSYGTFEGSSVYGEYSLTLYEDGTFSFLQSEASSGDYQIVDGYTILKRGKYGEDNLYLIADNETETFEYTE